MKLYVAAIRDRATAQFGNPYCLVNEGQALRSFSDEVNRKADDNQLYKHSDDFDLWHLGFFDTDTGLFSPFEPKQVVLGKSVRL